MGQTIAPSFPAGDMVSHAQAALLVSAPFTDHDTIGIGADLYVVDLMGTLSALVLASDVALASTPTTVTFTTAHGLVARDCFRLRSPLDKGSYPTEVLRVISVTSPTVVLAERNISGVGPHAFATGTTTVLLSDEPGVIVGAGHIPLGITDVASHTQLLYVLQNAITQLGTEPVSAVLPDATLGAGFGVTLTAVADQSGDVTIPVTSTLSDPSNDYWDNPTLTGGTGVRRFTSGTHVVTLPEIMVQEVVIVVDFPPANALGRFDVGNGYPLNDINDELAIFMVTGAPSYVRFSVVGLSGITNGNRLTYFITE
jgi:hypothetical protein